MNNRSNDETSLETSRITWPLRWEEKDEVLLFNRTPVLSYLMDYGWFFIILGSCVINTVIKTNPSPITPTKMYLRILISPHLWKYNKPYQKKAWNKLEMHFWSSLNVFRKTLQIFYPITLFCLVEYRMILFYLKY